MVGSAGSGIRLLTSVCMNMIACVLGFGGARVMMWLLGGD